MLKYKLLIKGQSPQDIIDVADGCFQLNEEYYGGIYPKGAREKQIYQNICSTKTFLIQPRKSDTNTYYHNYLYKLSNQRYPEQFWVEIFAYRFGCLIGIEVPPAFVAINTKSSEGENSSGAFIEWMYDPFLTNYKEAGDLFEVLEDDFDIKRGTTHNFSSCVSLLEQYKNDEKFNFIGDSEEFFVNMFIFDALIGNTDRHQNNWALLFSNDSRIKVKGAPFFDNGTSMGHEILNQKIDFQNIITYISKGRPHMRWTRDENRITFNEFIIRILKHFPHTKPKMLDLLSFSIQDVGFILQELQDFNVPTRLTSKRAKFMVDLINARQDSLIHLINR
jgi:hypothetical protein